MGRNKLGKFIIYGALSGGLVSMLDRNTRIQVTKKIRDSVTDVRFYKKNPDILKWKIQEKTEKVQSVYEQLSGDATYIKEQVDELKSLTPQVKDLMVNTKEAFTESKDEYKSIITETPKSELPIVKK
ncbi:YtxH domain-containing protein [Filibacter tadaridae]|uniref:YtxH-like protein n=1 Tax=Filibacter tadaridae TaxID=2483811 RepID=A0A3P5WW15_9BACL|nr:YtxH domain-containing protein [Filibacter tadaridae]VDC22686.1 hypothetical protein FILTAD_00843 [Filibacter tadaridae]